MQSSINALKKRENFMPFPHWQFFESLDDELLSLSRIVDFDKENFSTHSVHLTRMYLSICSEIDVVAKLLCSRIASKEKAKTIDDYRSLITDFYPKFPELKIVMPIHGLEFQPWIDWSLGINPPWWTSHNKVKHERDKYYQDANLGNVLSSAAGLLIVLVYYHQPELSPYGSPLSFRRFKTMRFPHPYFTYMTTSSARYNLPDFDKVPKK